MLFFSYILSAIKSLPAKGRKNGIKILSLGIGLAVSLVLLTKVCFEQTYDDFYDNADRWQQQFIEQAGLPWWVFVVTFTLTIALVALIPDVYVRIVTGSNPAESLKTG